MDKKKDTMQAPTSVATNTITPPAGAVSLQESPMQEDQQDFQKITSTDGPMYPAEDHQKLLSPRTPQEDIMPEGVSATDAQQAPTSVTNSTSTPGALHVDASSMKDPQDFQKGTLSDSPMYYPENLQPVPLYLEQDSVSSERRAGRSPTKKADETLKRYEKSQKTRFTGKQTRSQRKKNRSFRICSRRSLEDAKPPDVSSKKESVSPIQEAEQDRESEDEEIMTPGAVQIPGVNLMDSSGFLQDNLRMEHEQDSGYISLVAELAPEENDIEDRVAARLEGEMTQRMDQVVAERLEEERRRQVVAEAVEVLPPMQPMICGMSRKLFTIVRILLLVVIVGVVVGAIVALTRKDDAQTRFFGSERFETLLSNLSPNITVDNDTSFLRDRETAQSMALEWLADEDSAQLDLTETPLETVLERYALAVLFFGTLGESWRDSLGFRNSNSVCEWNDNSFGSDRGVYCDEETGSVIELRLKDNNVQGTLPSELGLLTRLEWLDLEGNSLSGSLPVEISSLKFLEHFWVHDNKLSGSIPTEIGNLENLRSVDFSNNVLTGTLPTEMGRLTLLNILMWGSNLLGGTLPTEIGNIPLNQMELNSNQLAGPIPSELGNLPFLFYVDFHDNDLSGPIPSELGKSTFLSHLFFGNNDLSGPIPSELGKLTLLEELHLNDNRLQGVVPPEFANLQNVNFIYIDNNALIGGIEYLFCDRIETPVQAFWSDCDDSLQPRILCSCCTHCCLPESGECTEKV